METFRIITDSCCDLTEAQLRNLQVTCANLSVQYNGENHSNFSEPAAVKAFYDELRSGVMASTAAANPENWADAMKASLDKGEDVLVITFTSGLSTTYQSAVIAAEDLREKYPQRKINVVDSLCAALGQGLLIWYACRKRDEGLSLEELTAWVEENKLHICHWVTVDDLSHLKRGGRISATTALVGTMLNIKPIIHVDHAGRVDIPAKAMGMRKGMEHLCKQADAKTPDPDFPLYVMYTNDRSVAETLAVRLAEHGQAVHPDNIIQVGAAIGSHIGPSACGLVYVGK